MSERTNGLMYVASMNLLPGPVRAARVPHRGFPPHVHVASASIRRHFRRFGAVKNRSSVGRPAGRVFSPPAEMGASRDAHRLSDRRTGNRTSPALSGGRSPDCAEPGILLSRRAETPPEMQDRPKMPQHPRKRQDSACSPHNTLLESATQSERLVRF